MYTHIIYTLYIYNIIYIIKTLSPVCIYIYYICIYTYIIYYIYKCVRCVVRSIGAPSTVACFRPVCWSSCRVIIKRRHRARPHSHHHHHHRLRRTTTITTATPSSTSPSPSPPHPHPSTPLPRQLHNHTAADTTATPRRHSFTSQPTQKYARITDLGAQCLLLSHEYYSTATVHAAHFCVPAPLLKVKLSKKK